MSLSIPNNAYCYTQCDTKTNTLYHNQQYNIYLCWRALQLILSTYCLQSADSQHSHCCCWPTDRLVFNTQTAHLCSHHVSASSLGCCCMEHFDLSKTCCINSWEVTEGISYSQKTAVRKFQIISLGKRGRMFPFLMSPPANDLPAPNIHRSFRYLPSYYPLNSGTL
jgi:hypothetical protein